MKVTVEPPATKRHINKSINNDKNKKIKNSDDIIKLSKNYQNYNDQTSSDDDIKLSTPLKKRTINDLIDISEDENIMDKDNISDDDYVLSDNGSENYYKERNHLENVQELKEYEFEEHSIQSKIDNGNKLDRLFDLVQTMAQSNKEITSRLNKLETKTFDDYKSIEKRKYYNSKRMDTPSPTPIKNFKQVLLF